MRSSSAWPSLWRVSSQMHTAFGANLEPGVPPTVAVACKPRDCFGLRLVAEFESLGFRGLSLSSPPSRSRVALSRTRRARRVRSPRFGPSLPSTARRFRIADRATGKLLVREMVSGDSTADGDAALALRVVELLRASLLEASLPRPRRARSP